MNKQINAIFLCIENRARSQMAEALLRHFAGDRFAVYSAGFDPSPIHPLVYQVMEEEGLDLEGHYPKSVYDFLNKLHFGYVITVCEKAEKKCPIFPGVGRRMFWPVEDPVAFEGSAEEALEKFREARDQLKQHILGWLDDLDTESDIGPTITLDSRG